MAVRAFVYLLVFSALFCVENPSAEPLRVAVAANFRHAFEQIALAYKPADIEAVYGSSGLLYAQISQGAPFALFLSADKKRPLELANNQLGDPESLTQYTRGLLVLWSVNGKANPQRLLSERFAMPNPKIAPFGVAAKTCMQTLRLWGKTPQPIMGTSVAQTFNFVASGAITNAWVALSQTLQVKIAQQALWRPPENCYQPIEQYALVLNTKRAQAAGALLRHLTSEKTQSWLQTQGYGALPQ